MRLNRLIYSIKSSSYGNSRAHKESSQGPSDAHACWRSQTHKTLYKDMSLMKDLNQVEWRRLFKNQALKDVQELVRGLWVFAEAAEANICKQTLKG